MTKPIENGKRLEAGNPERETKYCKQTVTRIFTSTTIVYSVIPIPETVSWSMVFPEDGGFVA